MMTSPQERYDLVPSVGRATRTSTLTALIFLGACILAGSILIWKVFQATRSGRAGDALTYSIVRSDLNAALRRDAEGSYLRDAISAVPTVLEMRVGGRAVTVLSDSLIVTDTVRFPALRNGGFLRDEVDRFNRSRRLRLEQLARGVGLARGQSFADLRETDNPSIFRTTVRVTGETGADTVVLADGVVTSAMRVASPFDTRKAITITSRDAPSASALVSGSGISILKNRGVTPGPFGCPFTARSDSVAIQCRAPNSPRREIVLRTDPSGNPRQLEVFSDDVVKYDGASVKAGAPLAVRAGGLLLLPPSRIAVRGTRNRPAAQSSAIEKTGAGTFGGIQWVNGRMQWRSNPRWRSPFLRQLATAAGFAGQLDLTDDRVIPLSLDDQLTRDSQEALERFVRSRPDGGNISYATLVLADAQTGEILSVAEAGQPTPNQGSWLLKATNFGSAVKPILAAAILSQLPELSSLQVYDPGGTVTSLWGRPLGVPLSTGCDTGWIGLRRFLACSSNLFAASLTAVGLQGGSANKVEWEAGDGGRYMIGGSERRGVRPRLPIDRRGRISPDSLFGSALGFGLDSLFDIVTGLEYAATQNRGQDSTFWLGLHYLGGGELSSPRGLWPEASKVGLALRGETASLRQVAAMAIGAAENRMTPLMILQSFTRIVTDTRVQLRFAPTDGIPVVSGKLGLRGTSWYPQLLGGLEDVAKLNGTAAGIALPLAGIAGPQTRFLAKTGTLNSGGKSSVQVINDTTSDGSRGIAERIVIRSRIPDVVAKSLIFAVGQGESAESPRLKCGITGAVYFRLRTRVKNGVPEHAQNLAREELWQIIRGNWARMGVCPVARVAANVPVATGSKAKPKAPPRRRARTGNRRNRN